MIYLKENMEVYECDNNDANEEGFRFKGNE